jgi:hypothetical protein
MQRLRLILVCHRCGFLELRYAVPSAPPHPEVLSLPIPSGWRQRWDDESGGFVLLCERCAEAEKAEAQGGP